MATALPLDPEATPEADDANDETLSTINTTPLVDVMMVLLIIFLVTVPVVVHTASVELPKDRNQVTQTKPQNVNIAVAKNGDIYWNEARIPDPAALLERLKTASTTVPQPEVHIWGDQNVRYEYIGRVVVACQRAGIAKIGFITEPPAAGH